MVNFPWKIRIVLLLYISQSRGMFLGTMRLGEVREVLGTVPLGCCCTIMAVNRSFGITWTYWCTISSCLRHCWSDLCIVIWLPSVNPSTWQRRCHCNVVWPARSNQGAAILWKLYFLVIMKAKVGGSTIQWIDYIAGRYGIYLLYICVVCLSVCLSVLLSDLKKNYRVN